MTDRIPYRGRICSNCDGFPIVAVSSGLGRDPRGQLRTVKVTCRTCQGSGFATVRALVRTGGVAA